MQRNVQVSQTKYLYTKLQKVLREIMPLIFDDFIAKMRFNQHKRHPSAHQQENANVEI